MSRSPDNGAYRTHVTIQALSEDADALGQLVETWTTVATLWARKRQATGGERQNAVQAKAVAEYVLETWHPRSLVTVTPSHRCLIDGVPYGISLVDNLGDRNETLLIYVTRQVLPVES